MPQRALRHRASAMLPEGVRPPISPFSGGEQRKQHRDPRNGTGISSNGAA